jgi:hypothetical protein
MKRSYSVLFVVSLLFFVSCGKSDKNDLKEVDNHSLDDSDILARNMKNVDAKQVRRDVIAPYINNFCLPYTLVDQVELGNAIKVFGVVSAQLAAKGLTAAAGKISLFYGAYDSLCNVGQLFLAALDADIAWANAHNISLAMQDKTAELCMRLQSIPRERRSVGMPNWCADTPVSAPIPGIVPCVWNKVRSDAPSTGAGIYEDQWLSEHLQPGGAVGAGISVERELTVYAGNILVVRVTVHDGALAGRTGWMLAGSLTKDEDKCR